MTANQEVFIILKELVILAYASIQSNNVKTIYLPDAGTGPACLLC